MIIFDNYLKKNNKFDFFFGINNFARCCMPTINKIIYSKKCIDLLVLSWRVKNIFFF